MSGRQSPLVCVLLVCASGTVSAQSTPPPGAFAPLEAPIKPGVTIKYSLTPAERQALWRNATKADGYFVSLSSALAVTIPSQMRAFAKPQTGAVACSFDKRWQLVGQIVESKNRLSYVFEREGKLAALTWWRFFEDGGHLYLIDEFLNIRVRDSRGALAFVREAGSPASGMWKAAWNDGRSEFELYVEDSIGTEGRPATSAAEVLALANAIDCDTPRAPSVR